MKITVDCYPCILGQVANFARAATPDKDEQLKLARMFLRFISEADELTSPPEIAARIFEVINSVSGIGDPLSNAKIHATNLALELLPELRKITADARDPFEAAVRLSIGGNIIDYGANPDFELASVERELLGVFDQPLDIETVAEFRRQANQARSIFFILDNCGEIVIDRLLMDFFPGKVTLGVRGKPIFNDATPTEALLSGLGDLPLVDTGDNAPGVVERRSSPEFLHHLYNSDLIIAKGQGNYETLDSLERPIFHLLRIKCPTIAKIFSLPQGALHICGRNLPA